MVYSASNHQRVNMYSCTECSRKYEWPSDLKRHMRIKHQKKPQSPKTSKQKYNTFQHPQVPQFNIHSVDDKETYERTDMEDSSSITSEDTADSQDDVKEFFADTINDKLWMMRNPYLLTRLFHDKDNNHPVQCPGCEKENAKAFWFARCTECGEVHVYPKYTTEARLKCNNCHFSLYIINDTCEHHVAICLDCNTGFVKSPSQFKKKPKQGYPSTKVHLVADEEPKDIFN